MRRSLKAVAEACAADYRRYIAFELGEPHRGYPGIVARSVGPHSILGPPPDPRLGAIRAMTWEVTRRYRAVLDSLVAAGRLPQGEAHLLGNCRPAGFRVRPAQHACTLVNFCPHCLTRRAVEFWTWIDAARFPPDGGGKRARAAACDLMLTSRRIGPDDVRVYDDGLPSVVAERLAARWDGGPQFLGSRSLEMRRLRRHFIWAIEGLVVDIAYRGARPRGWNVAVRQLIAVPAGSEFPSPAREGMDDFPVHLRRVETPTRREAADMVIRLCRYPRGLLGGGGRTPPAAVVDHYLDTIHRKRLWARYKGLSLPAAPSKLDGDG
jgi:hypothetical protein